MKKIFFSLLLLSVCLFTTNCTLDSCTEQMTYEKWTPIYKKVDEIRLDIKAESAREMKNPGKLYFYDGYIFINEVREGFHIIDNRNPAAPRNVAFMKIPGSVDIAVKDGILLADSYIDLVAVDITNPEQPKLAGRTENVFTNFSLHQDLGYLVDYERSKETVKIDCNSGYWGKNFFSENGNVFTNIDATFDSSPFGGAVPTSTVKPSTGVGGSMARFTISQNHLYAIDHSNIKVFDINTAKSPIGRRTVPVMWGIETLFPYKDKLFVGSNSGMFIYDLAKADNPVQLSQFTHARACDPVFVDNDIAYVTLRSGTPCEGFSNQLEVIDVKDLKKPVRLKTYLMKNPHGLSILDNTLYLCEGKHGLKIFDAKDIMNIDKNEIKVFGDLQAYDVIALPSNYSALKKPIAMVIGEDGFAQYDVTDKKDIRLLSTIKVKK